MWFVILSGEHEGRAHLNGWRHTAKMVLDDTTGRGRWWAIAYCPRCHAIVQADEDDPYGDLTWSHERWHAATDHPIPDEVAAKVTRP